MRKKIHTLLLVTLVSALSMLHGQNDASSVSSQLQRLFDNLAKTNIDSVRTGVNDSIKLLVESYVESDTVFSHRFSNVRYLGQITSPDSLIKLVTWNLFLRNEPGHYYCYIIRKQKQGMPNLIYRLTADYNPEPLRSDTTYSSENWYGALYYEISPHIIRGIKSWVLLGIDYGNPDITRKLIEILSFDDNEKVVFGIKSFLASKTLRYREIFEYSSTATMSLRFGNDNSIVFDHLVPVSGGKLNNRQFYVPDFSSNAYFLQDGLWKFRLNIDVRNKEKVILQP